ncbi:MAG: uroporphyrinogen decarboxylase [Lysobacterales bacterium 69-70]|nr:uroporphyrinogen decarboxylase [Xanthomonadaceae bacterium]ODU35223.1 MAG: uroporphyrinogen decarboxylase [Xanthomonadaceae bacterium SCN 69-320]ODV15773.1 MAG: uroporphyrinogen decarboxylase [Xanthomonadaceae bacterium SCN 69-25]OJY94123.1 MAG: uroporphyrinogen decarboxylase [Xanthomonadales bacterium 69-70]
MNNDRFLRALRCEPVDCTPVWLMRQAGRYLPEYRATRAQAGSFMALCTNPELACEVTLQPLRRFALDAAILFSDILTIPDAMGLGLHFADGEGPKFRSPVRTAADVARLGVPDPEGELRYVMDAVRTIRRELNGSVPLIGFAGSPWTLACYMVQGEGSSNFPLPKAMLWNEPALMHQLLDTVARSVTTYLTAQAAAGAQALMVFDTWGGMLAPAQFSEFSLHYLGQIAAALKADPATRDIPLILFSKGANGHLPGLAATGCDALGVDWTLDLSSARALVGDRIALQGNLDPAALHASPDAIRREVARVLASHGPGPGHVFNLGHGITPDVKPEHVAALVDAVHELSRR